MKKGNITTDQIDAIIRAVGLTNRHDVLSPFEASLLKDLIERYQYRGDRTNLTDNEVRVLEEAVGALDAAQADHMRRLKAAAHGEAA